MTTMITIIMTLTALGLAGLSVWCARKALEMNRVAQAHRRAADYWRKRFVDQGGKLGL